MSINEYFKEIENKVKVAYVIAEEARKKGLDPKSKVEIPLATNLAGRAIGLVSILYPQLNNDKTINRILELEKEHGALDPAICLKIAEEIAKEKFCKFQSLQEGIDAGIRAAIAYTTLGVVSSPIEGFTNFKLNKTRDNGDYIAAYFSGPIRSAGGTAAAFSLVIIDYLRETFGYAKYDPTEQEVKRFVSEIYDYHERITNLQYLPSEQEVEFLAMHLPIQVTGEASEEKEVSNYKDLERIETNMIRSGPCLVLAEGLAQKAPKILKMVNKLRAKGFALSDWSFLKDFVELQQNIKKNKKKAESATYIQDLVAGRPVFAHPSKSGAFRLRYGRTRCSGYSALSVHPATMYALKGFIAVGTQLKIELPTKGAAVTACDSIEGPIVRMNNDSVRKLKDIRQAKEISKDICEIIYLGDLLVPYGDFLNRNHILMPCGYTQEQWFLELKKNGLKELGEFNPFNVSFEKAAELSERYKTALHPDFTYYWSQIAYGDFLALLDWLACSRINERLIFPYNKTEQDTFKRAKRTLELIGCCHDVTTENVVLSEEDSRALLCNLGLGHLSKKIGNRGEDGIEGGDKAPDYFLKQDVEEARKKLRHSEDMIQVVNTISNFMIKDKAGTFIGARMGRPEKAKLRKLTGNPNVLFPVGEEGGRMRSVQAACKSGSVKADFPIYFCENCNKETIYFVCENCNKETKKKYYCKDCGQTFASEKCPQHAIGQPFASKRIEVSYYLDEAAKKMNLQREEIPQLIKGVKGTSSSNHAFEHLCKGILRAIYNLTVNKDGTIRYDATELPITHFKPKEISTSVEMLKKLGYGKDMNGAPLENDEQILEIKPHDIILPACPETKDEKADDVFVRISKFIDSMLVRFYNQKPFYNIGSREELAGHLVTCIAPHNAACVVARIIGFSKMQAILASPYIHAACRRDCDGDEIAIMLLLDTLINFSREFLPAHRGGTQDAPLVLNARIRAGEVDDMIFDIDVAREMPLELYEAARQFKHPSEVKVEQIRDRLGGTEEFTNLNYTHETGDINNAVMCSSYKTLLTMQEKIKKQMEVVDLIRAANANDVARLVIERHLIRDIRGNLRKFSMQEFRCSTCNEKYRRPPLQGNCIKCHGNIIFTISEGSIVKYLEPALALAQKYNVSEYVRQTLELTKSYIESIFGREKEKQEALKKWF